MRDMLALAAFLSLVGGCVIGAHVSRPSVTGDDDAVQALEKAFPGGLQVHQIEGARLVQFCPDNTCEAFISNDAASVDELTDFAYLFVYYFSEYRVLDTWRATGDAGRIAGRVVARRRTTGCAVGGGKDDARCVLRAMAGTRGIRVEGIRYDEGARSVVPMEQP